MIIDTSVLVCILLGEPEAERFASTLADASSVFISAPSWVEVSMVITARLGEPGYKHLLELLAAIQAAIVSCDEGLARAAYDAWLQYGRGRHPAGLNFGDCFSYALAKQLDEPLLFKGEDFSKTDIVSAVRPVQ